MTVLYFGGRRGIRTPGGFHLNGFQDRRVRPLRHPSVSAARKRQPFFVVSERLFAHTSAVPRFQIQLLGGAPLSGPSSQRCEPRKKSASVPAPECVPMTFPT